MEWIVRHAQAIAKAAYWLYTLAGSIALLMLPLVLSQDEGMFWAYLPLWLVVLPMAGTAAIVLTAIRLLAGLDWKLAVLLVSTISYLTTFFLEMAALLETDDFKITVAFGTIAAIFCVWHFLYDKETGSQAAESARDAKR